MKPAPFELVIPRTLDEALDSLAESGSDAKILAGGQSLVPLLNMRLSSPRRLVDLNRIAGLAGIQVVDGFLVVGAMTRDRSVERSRLVATAVPLLADAIGWVGHPQIRNRGTIGGSIAHADPSGELPAVAVALEAEVALKSARGERVVAAANLYLGYLQTTVEPDEVVTEIRIPVIGPHTGHAWLEFARRHGDYAIVGAGTSVTLDPARDVVARASIVLTGVGGMPFRARDAEGILTGGPLDAAHVRAAVEAVRASLDPDADVHATAAYRRHLAGVLVGRTLARAHERARQAGRAAALDIRRSLEDLAHYA